MVILDFWEIKVNSHDWVFAYDLTKFFDRIDLRYISTRLKSLGVMYLENVNKSLPKFDCISMEELQDEVDTVIMERKELEKRSKRVSIEHG